ncbi:acyl-CoA dehydrogenase family protein [Halieaceae bacterium IMCC14734]|uniref:Medium-chain specific acyl-CoA dehydrogenase, mitochondrial n=1 Tax=Candidatus Litorirhabdus singularis TaxID=2518993 RepID=A0ABT3TG26_9GAMM|nr:acyl-CoA dehydrogenase family protein [Candidatus Litorirhabdus singularis]MCX2981262.1 acyl-CoA dehydrogenase family protein [Candidatus Litorirhabdus singularis]
MNFELDEEFRKLEELVNHFVEDHLYPLESRVLEREARGEGAHITAAERETLDSVSRELGLWGLDAPEDVGGMALPGVALVAVNEAIGKSVVPYVLPPDSPNLSMLAATVTEAQRERYLAPYVAGKTISAIAISEPGAGTDPAAMATTAVLDGDEWVINGRKIWITRADVMDFAILMAVTDKEKGSRGGISAFLLDAGTPGLRIARKIPMIGGNATFELELEDCRLPVTALLGEQGKGFAPMQLRLSTRRLEMSTWCIGIAQRALDMMLEYAPQRHTFGSALSEKQTIQNWLAEAESNIHSARLMAYHTAWKLDQGQSVRREISMLKAHATEMAWTTVDRAMQCYGAMGMTKELPLQQMANEVRLMRIYDGPTEIHKWVVARDLLSNR